MLNLVGVGNDAQLHIRAYDLRHVRTECLEQRCDVAAVYASAQFLIAVVVGTEFLFSKLLYFIDSSLVRFLLISSICSVVNVAIFASCLW